MLRCISSSPLVRIWWVETKARPLGIQSCLPRLSLRSCDICYMFSKIFYIKGRLYKLDYTFKRWVVAVQVPCALVTLSQPWMEQPSRPSRWNDHDFEAGNSHHQRQVHFLPKKQKTHMFAVCICLATNKFNVDARQGRMVDLQDSAANSNKVTRPHPKRYWWHFLGTLYKCWRKKIKQFVHATCRMRLRNWGLLLLC